MGLSADARRRWTGGILLAASAVMLVAGLTVLRDRMSPRFFVVYWLTCLVLNALTMIVALLDLRAVRRRSQRERQELARTVLSEFIREDSE